MSGVYEKEMKSYLTSMIGYVFIAFVLAVIGIYFSYENLNLANPRFEVVLDSVQIIFLVFVPVLTMRILAEEKRQRTDQLLFTLPLKLWEIVLGKYLAMVTMFAIPMAIVWFYPFILGRFGEINARCAYLGILMFFLLGCADIAIGLYMSSLTENPVIAAVLTFGTLLASFIMSSLSQMVPNTAKASFLAYSFVVALLSFVVYSMVKDIKSTLLIAVVPEAVLGLIFLLNKPMLEGSFPRLLKYFHLNGRLSNGFAGILSVSDIVYYLSVAAIFLLLTHQTLEKRRWS